MSHYVKTRSQWLKDNRSKKHKILKRKDPQEPQDSQDSQDPQNSQDPQDLLTIASLFLNSATTIQVMYTTQKERN